MKPFDQQPIRRFGKISYYCTQPHSHLDGAQWKIAPNAQLGVLIQSNGVPKHYAYCVVCGTKTSALPKYVVEHLLARGWEIRQRKINAPTIYPPCSYRGCPTPANHWHHTAPRNTFIDADNWPVMPFCEDHHRIWHQKMDGYQWNTQTPEWEYPDDWQWEPQHRMQIRWT